MLQCLYQDENGDEVFTDGKVSNDVWEMVKKFIDERQRLETMLTEAENEQCIYEKALEFNAGNLYAGPKSSPPLLSQGISSPSAPIPRSPAIKTEEGAELFDSSSFLSSILKRKSRVARASSQRAVTPYHALAAAVSKRTEMLRIVIEKYKRARAEADRLRFSDPFAADTPTTEVLVTLQTKERLWNMLSQHLQSIVVQDDK